jgi:hypothetical protein
MAVLDGLRFRRLLALVEICDVVVVGVEDVVCRQGTVEWLLKSENKAMLTKVLTYLRRDAVERRDPLRGSGVDAEVGRRGPG